MSGDLTEQEVAAAKVEFEKHDKNNSGTIDRTELKDLLISTVGKKWSAAQAERMVNGQMQLMDKDDSGEVSFDEFLAAYKKINASSHGAPGAVQMPGMAMPSVKH